MRCVYFVRQIVTEWQRLNCGLGECVEISSTGSHELLHADKHWLNSTPQETGFGLFRGIGCFLAVEWTPDWQLHTRVLWRCSFFSENHVNRKVYYIFLHFSGFSKVTVGNLLQNHHINMT